MWIEMLETYAGLPGLFLKGEKRDVPESIAKQIAVKGKRIWRKCDPVRLGDGMFPSRSPVSKANTNKSEQPAVDTAIEQAVSDKMTND